jgi:hypothetical protein
MVLTTLPDLKKGTHSSQLFEELSTAESSVFAQTFIGVLFSIITLFL